MPRKSQPVAVVEEVAMEADEEEAKRLKAERKAAKKAAKLAEQKDQEQQLEETAMEVDEEEAKKLKAERKAAKKAAKLAAQEEQPQEVAAEVDEEEAARLKAERKAAKKAAKLAAANGEQVQAKAEEDEAPKKKRKAEKKDGDHDALPESKPEKKQKVQETEAVDEEKAPAEKNSSTESTEELTVFVGGIPWSVTEETFKKDFLECGEIEKLNFLLNDEGKPKGIAFITFKTKAGVDAALKFDGDDYGGRTLKVNLAGQGGKGKDGKSKGKGKDGKGKDGKDGKGKGKGNENEIFVGGLAFECTEEALKEQISKHGVPEDGIVSLRMPLNEEGKAKGIAFICLKTAEEVEKALKLDGEEFMGRTLKVNKAGEGKGKGKDGKGKDGKGKDGKGKAKGKGKKGGMSSEKKAAKDGAMVESTGVKQTFEDSDDE